MEHRGQIAIASIFDVVDDPYYKYKALIETGNLSKKECYVAYRGNPDKLKGDIVVRLEDPFKEESKLNLDGAITSNFVTSTPPKGFEFASSDKVLFYGIWEERMKNNFNVPIMGKIKNYYDIGKTPAGLHYAYIGRIIVPYRLHGKTHEIMTSKEGNIFNVKGAWDNYLRRINKLPDKDVVPRRVTIDDVISLESRILDTLTETGLTLIEMEPQQ